METLTAHDKLANLLGAISVVVHDALSQVDASSSRASAIICIGSHPDESIEDLSHALSLSHSGTVRLVDRLERENLLTRTRTEKDRRTSRLRLSPQGHDEFQLILNRRRKAIGHLMEALPPQAGDALSQSLETMLKAATTSRTDARRICRLCAEADCRPQGCPVEAAVHEVA